MLTARWGERKRKSEGGSDGGGKRRSGLGGETFGAKKKYYQSVLKNKSQSFAVQQDIVMIRNSALLILASVWYFSKVVVDIELHHASSMEWMQKHGLSTIITNLVLEM